MHIYLFSPSGAVDAAKLDAAVTNLEKLNFKVSVDKTARKRHMRFAGTDAERAAAFGRAAASDAQVCMMTRGGYGISRILPSLDLSALAKSGKRWVGFSDFTAFHCALSNQLRPAKSIQSAKLLSGTSGLAFAGPGVEEFAAAELDEVMVGSFLETLEGQTEAVGWDAKIKHGEKTLGTPACTARGPLWGGSLSMLCSVMGTPYWPRVAKQGGLFFCEDVGEYPYRTERCFAQLLAAGVLQRQKAVILGQFSEYRLSSNDNGFDIPVIVKWLREQLAPHGVPVVVNLPFGHVQTKVTLPWLVEAQLIVERNSAFIVFAHDDRHHH